MRSASGLNASTASASVCWLPLKKNAGRITGGARIEQFQSEFLRQSAHFKMRAVNELTAELGGQARTQHILHGQDATAGPFRRFINLRPQARFLQFVSGVQTCDSGSDNDDLG